MEILNIYKVVEAPEWSSLFLVLLTIGIAAFVVVAVLQFLDREYLKGILCLALAAVCLAGVFGLKNYCKRNYARERYEVRIDSSITARELVENWDIIETRGEILVVERKGPNEN